MAPLHLLLISDSTGETVLSAVSAAVSQFAGQEVTTELHPFLRRPADIDALAPSVWARADIVVFTLVRAETRARLEALCRVAEIPAVSLLDGLLAALTQGLGVVPSSRPGRQHLLGPGYLDRIAAIDFAMGQDDGAAPERLAGADVILTGVSRTSKTPTCIYLAYHGLRAANVPLIPGRPPPPGLEPAMAAGVPVIGLTATAARLSEIRRTRSDRIGQGATDYTDPEAIAEELAEALLFFDTHDVPVIDVTRRSIEETAASIRTILRQREPPC